MKILLLNDEFYTTGASIAMLRLAERLVQQHEVMVMPRRDGEGEIRKQFEALGIPIVHNVTTVDVVVANTLMAGLHVAEAGPKVPVVWWIHEAEVGRDLILRFPALAPAFQHASQIVFQTSYQQKVYQSFLFDSPASCHVLPFWNDAIYRQEDLGPKPKRGKRIVCIGTIEPRKRMEDTVLAVEAMPPALREEVECVFIGKYLELPEQARRIADAAPQRYRFLGEQANDEVLRYLASADTYVLASYSESQPLSIWEAFELEVPVCLSDLETYGHIGLQHGRNALMHPVGQTAVLSANLQQLLTRPTLARELARAGKSLLLKNLTRDWADEFERIIARAAMGAELRKLGY
ncbi:glycosyltransferase family 4 protein [Herbaspirillum seropedicae]|uniref:Alpha-D-mannose-alpha(1-6)phosphatidyl myo-inositol monomannoside transferase protein n=1 Tax=Herbaspirillum seropedicae (strain SmR1) TaxID=757424 RepID=D8IVT3_HERSS|nr:glycosyltransferase family 4 protein [Herbaspirillum seropedicae]ADJ65891.1 alpha-D-mannose-alpha(1-6)phosphatidyl myo-inositol monomannoside transferase protein [Herbaspirillum seropedicae SmR1]AKN67680.1 glycosyl transferase [Herbaspirillum seropedicae]NQE29723.1 glycosyl transferase [Herbaspirillum seropedicae]UMU23703.1 glycosyltransferase family 4 protein [Herbaspirillum seropedicae]